MMPTHELVEQLEDARFGCLTAGDWDGFEALCDEQLRYTHMTGVTDTRESYVAKGRADYYDYGAIDHPIESILVRDDVAIVCGRMRCDLVAGGIERQIDNVTVAVWVRTGSTWRLWSHQSTASPVALPEEKQGSSATET